MKSKTKLNPLTLIILLSAITFIVVFIWKFNNVDVSETVYVAPIQKESTAKDKKQFVSRTEHPQIEQEINDEDSMTQIEIIEQAKITSQSNLFNSYLLSTPEDILKAINLAQAKNNTELEQKYIDLLLEKFPDYKF